MTSSSYHVFVLKMRRMANGERPTWTFSLSSAETEQCHHVPSLNELMTLLERLVADKALVTNKRDNQSRLL